MEYKLSKDFNPNVQTLPLLTKSEIIECFSKWCTKEGSQEYIKRCHDAKALLISVGNIYTEDHLMHTFSENFQHGVK